MKRIALALGAVVGVFGLLLVVGLMTLSSPIVENTYATLQSAREDQLFVRGWLPEVLPPSTSRIRVKSNLDLNTSGGSFEVSLGVWPLLRSKLKAGSLAAPFVDWEETVENYRRSGFLPWHYAEKDGDWSTIWVFFCNQEAGHCKHVMWMRREG